MRRELSRRLLGEFWIGVPGGARHRPGIAAQQLSPDDRGLALLERGRDRRRPVRDHPLSAGSPAGNSTPPSRSSTYFGGLSWRDALAYAPAEIAGRRHRREHRERMFALAAITSPRTTAPAAHTSSREAVATSACCRSSSRSRAAGARARRPPPSAPTSAPPTGSPARRASRTPRQRRATFSDTFAGTAPARCRRSRRRGRRRLIAVAAPSALDPDIAPGEPPMSSCPTRRRLWGRFIRRYFFFFLKIRSQKPAAVEAGPELTS